MPPIDTMLTVAFAGFALSATPGPSMLYVLSRSVGQSRAAGVASALGLGLGGVLLAIATALGLAAIFAKFDWLVVTLRYLGAAYLLWLGINMIRDAQTAITATNGQPVVAQKSFAAIVWQGVMVELLNPKTVLFFALFLPPFVSTGRDQITAGSVTVQLLTLGILVPLTAIPSDLFVAYMGGSMTKAIARQQFIRKALAWAGGLILIAIAMNLYLQII